MPACGSDRVASGLGEACVESLVYCFVDFELYFPAWAWCQGVHRTHEKLGEGEIGPCEVSSQVWSLYQGTDHF